MEAGGLTVKIAATAALVLSLALVVPVLAPARAHAQASQDKGLHIEGLSSAAPGTVQVLVAPDPALDSKIGPTPAASDFTVWLAGGAAQNLSVARNGSRGKPLTTIVLVDESGSYKTGHGDKVARPTIVDYVGGAGTDELALILFSQEAKVYPVHTSPADFVTDLNELRGRNARGATSVTVGVGAAIALAIKEGEPGLREVVIFTDAGDEAGYDKDMWDRLLNQARDGGVRVSTVLPVAEREPKDTKHSDWVSTLAKLEELARITGGFVLHTEAPGEATTRLRDARTALKSWLMLEGTLCGVQRGQPVAVRVDYVAGGARQASTADATLATPTYAPGAEARCPSACTPDCAAWEECLGKACAALQCDAGTPCPGGATCEAGRCVEACTATCAAWQECHGGACTAKACTSAEICGIGATCKDGTCAKAAGKSSGMLVWLLAGAGALLLVVALLVLFRKKKPAPVTAAPFVAEPAPVIEPLPSPSASAPDLDPLPETHLVAIGGWATPGERWRLNQRRTLAGASGDPADGVDLRFAIKQVSSKHCAFELYPSGDLWVTDLGSSNGTYVNGRRLVPKARTRLVVGDQVKLSQQLILVVERPGVVAEERPPEPPVAAGPGPAADEAPVKTKARTKFDPGDR